MCEVLSVTTARDDGACSFVDMSCERAVVYRVMRCALSCMHDEPYLEVFAGNLGFFEGERLIRGERTLQTVIIRKKKSRAHPCYVALVTVKRSSAINEDEIILPEFSVGTATVGQSCVF